MRLRLQIALAFLAVYLIWGSTYLAIRFVIESLPPFFMAGARFLLAGTILYLVVRMRGASGTGRPEWVNAFIIGGLMLVGGHGAVVWMEQWVPSGLTSLLVATVPLWIVFLDWLHGGAKPSSVVTVGVAFGFVGVILLASPTEVLGESHVDLLGAMILVLGAFLWANGSLYSRSARLPSSRLLAIAMEMIAGGLLLLVASGIAGEWTRINLGQMSLQSLISWIYLVVFGSLAGFTSYVWLLKAVTPARASTYAYVNPVVAMFLGWLLANEPINLRNVLAAVIILTSVVAITTYEAKKERSQGIKH